MCLDIYKFHCSILHRNIISMPSPKRTIYHSFSWYKLNNEVLLITFSIYLLFILNDRRMKSNAYLRLISRNTRYFSMECVHDNVVDFAFRHETCFLIHSKHYQEILQLWLLRHKWNELENINEVFIYTKHKILLQYRTTSSFTFLLGDKEDF